MRSKDLEALTTRIEDTLEMLEIADNAMVDELQHEIEVIQRQVDELELRTLLSGKYDRGNALLAIHAGAGEPICRIGLRCWSGCIFDGRKTEITKLTF